MGCRRRGRGTRRRVDCRLMRLLAPSQPWPSRSPLSGPCPMTGATLEIGGGCCKNSKTYCNFPSSGRSSMIRVHCLLSETAPRCRGCFSRLHLREQRLRLPLCVRHERNNTTVLQQRHARRVRLAAHDNVLHDPRGPAGAAAKPKADSGVH
jgi:hypothetical protein